MLYEDKCQICNVNLTENYCDYSDGILYEERKSCPNNHYSYLFAHGSSEIMVGDKTFYIHYTFSMQEFEKVRKEIDQAIAEEKEKWNAEDK